MNEKDRTTLKTYFETGDRPTEDEFAQLIDSFVNKLEDKVLIIIIYHSLKKDYFLRY